MIQKIYGHIKKFNIRGPIIIHCNAGIGRSGTITVIFEFLDYIRNIITDVSPCLIYGLDIPSLIINLRKFQKSWLLLWNN